MEVWAAHRVVGRQSYSLTHCDHHGSRTGASASAEYQRARIDSIQRENGKLPAVPGQGRRVWPIAKNEKEARRRKYESRRAPRNVRMQSHSTTLMVKDSTVTMTLLWLGRTGPFPNSCVCRCGSLSFFLATGVSENVDKSTACGKSDGSLAGGWVVGPTGTIWLDKAAGCHSAWRTSARSNL